MKIFIIFILIIFNVFCKSQNAIAQNYNEEIAQTHSVDNFFELWNIKLNKDFKLALRSKNEESLFIKLNNFLSLRITKTIFKSEPIDKTRFSIILDFPEINYPVRNDKLFNFRDNLISEIYRELTYDKVEAIGHARVGLAFKYDQGQLSEISCHHLPGSNGSRCEDSILLNSDGSIREVKEYKIKCKQGCGQFQPLRQKGYYFISTNQVRIREKPDTKSKIIAELSKDVRVEVIKDAEKYEKIFPHFAAWAQVKLDDGREGYVYGAFLRAPGEPDVVAIREKAVEWKKVNRVKAK
ncbi:MAG: SH3 domain-containing protein [Leptospira sp.]|nr:SH3 domain-containing protein [Leptospira sp.]